MSFLKYVIFSSIIINLAIPLYEGCNLNSSCGSFQDNTVQSITCFESTKCIIPNYSSSSSCDSNLHTNLLYNFPLKDVNIIKIKNDYWINLSFAIPFNLFSIEEKRENEDGIILKILYSDNIMQTCYNFFIPSAHFSHFEEYFTLPCFKLNYEYLDFINIHTTFFNKNIQSNLSQILYSQETTHSIEKLKNQKFSHKDIWNPSIKFERDFFFLELESSLQLSCHFFYNISIHEECVNQSCDIDMLYNWISTATGPFLSLNCSDEIFKNCQPYYIKMMIQIDDACGDIKHKEFNEKFFFHANLKTKPEIEKNVANNNCETWNGSLLISPDLNDYVVTLSFTPFDEYQNCFDGYDIYLFKSDDCYEGTQDKYRHINSPIDKKTAVIKFENVTPGDYCIQVQPYFHSCKCPKNVYAIHSKVFNIKKPIPNFRERKMTTTEPPFVFKKTLTIALTSVLLIIFLAALGGILYRRYRPLSKRGNIMVPPDDYPSLKDDKKFILPEETKVYIFSEDDEKINFRTDILKDFFSKCAKFCTKTFDDIYAFVTYDPSMWVARLMSYHCVKMGDNMSSNIRIILVESEKAVRRQLDSYNVPAKNLKETVFYELLSTICSKPYRRQMDHCHLFVIRFDDITPAESKFQNILEGESFHVTNSEQLINLCLKLNPCQPLQVDARKEYLGDCLKNHPFKNFLEKNQDLNPEV